MEKVSSKKLKRVWLLTLLLLLIFFHPTLLNSLSSLLYRADKLQRVDAIIVLAGDRRGLRMASGIGLYKDGWAKKIITSGGQIYWHTSAGELAAEQAVQSGVPEQDVIWTDKHLDENSTYGEALQNMVLMKEAGLTSFILVTSDFHTARAGMVYDELAKQSGVTAILYGADDDSVGLKDWWKKRESAKAVYMELNKLLYYRWKQFARQYL